ncbi:uncharacterized protein LOC119731635 [Patiria miniata]|uniref:Uncharacterized protein n=1 Tax=Patiria miniata TaxID=46514 RepID=A0A914AA77_PATMI|nr:uncharacterized protein LOC119731635 [Patiria miniata]
MKRLRVFVMLILAVILWMFAGVVNSQTTGGTATPITTTTPYPEIIIDGCPPVIEPAYTRYTWQPVDVYWNAPSAGQLTPVTDTPQGNRFSLGVTEVTYIFTDPGGNSAECVFNVTVLLQCPSSTDHPCENGVCVPTSTMCDGFNDCGDGRFGSDEQNGECELNQACRSAEQLLYGACVQQSQWINAREAVRQVVKGQENTVFKFTAPSSATELTRLHTVRINVTDIIDLERKEIPSPTVFLNISSSSYSTTARAQVSGQLGTGLLEIEIRLALPVQPNEEILVSMEFDDNILAGRPPFPAESTNITSVSVRYATFKPGCDNSDCLDAFVAWKAVVQSATSGPGPRVCVIPESAAFIQSIYDSCLDLPEFEFVSPSVSAPVESQVILKCIGRGVVPPLVEWYEDGNAVASGYGAAAFEVSVGETRSFQCVLDNSIWYGETVTVSVWSEECQSLDQDVQDVFQLSNPCFNDQMLTLLNDGQSREVSFSYFTTEPIVAYRLFVPVLAFVGYVEPDYGSDAPNSGQTPVLLPVRLTMTLLNLSRKRRDVNSDEIYTREYRNLYVPVLASEKVRFVLDPPVSISASRTLFVSVTVLEGQGGFVERPPVGPAQLAALSCTQSNDSTCDNLLDDWSQKQQNLEAAGCRTERSLELMAYQICQGASAAEPVVITHPKSVDVTLLRVIDSPPVGTAVMTCYIENAVEYEWYKVAPVPARKLVKSGSTLSFTIGQSNPGDQGSYVCVGKGGAPYNSTVETRPATLTVDGFSVFKVTARFVGLTYTGNLSDSNSQEYMSLSGDVRNRFAILTDSVPASGYGFDIVGFSPGSVIADVIVYVGQPFSPGMLDSELAEEIATALNTPLPESLEVEVVEVVSLVTCFGEEVDGLRFPQAKVGQTVHSVERCPEITAKAGMPRGTRDCAGNILSEAIWLGPVLLDCLDGENANALLEELSQVNVTSENVPEIADQTVVLTSNHSQIDASGIMATADILEKIVNVGTPSTEVALDVVRVVNNILQVDDETYEDLGEDPSPSRIILALEGYITELQTSNATGNLTAVHSDIAVVAIVVPQDSLQIGLGFAAVPQGSGQEGDSPLTEDDVMVYFEPERIPIPDVKASITLPPEILDFVSPGDTVPISFFFYRSSKLYRSPKLRAAARPVDNFSRAVGSYIIAATVEGVRVQDLPMEAPVSSAFLPVNVGGPEDTVNGSQCVFWDFSLNDNFGDWSTEGCSKVTVNNTRTVCHCDHLTSFAVIVDIYGNQDNIVLSIISKIGCAVSLVALVITIITYVALKKLRSKRPQQILLHFCFALAGLYLAFLAGIEATASGVGCIIVAVLIHYFTLASVSWMAVEATNMYLLFVRVLNANVSNFLLIASILAWGLPLVVVIIILAVDHTNYMTADYCFLRPDNALYFGQILPIGLVLIYNFVVFTLVMRQLTCARKSIKSSTDRTQRQEVTRRLQNALAISVLLGLTWVFGLLSLVQTANFAFQVLFCIFNSLQGLMIFLLFCVRQQEIRQAWWKFLTCQCRKDRAADYSKGTGSKSRQRDSHGQGTIPLTHQSTNSTNTS